MAKATNKSNPLITPELLRLRPRNDGWTVAHSAAFNGLLNQIDSSLITPRLLRLRMNSGSTVAHVAAFNGHLNQIDPSLITPRLLRLRDDSGWTVAHAAADYDHLDQIDPSLITPELLRLRTDAGRTVAQDATWKPKQLSRLLSRISSLTPDVQADYRTVLGEKLVPTAGTGHEAPAA